jgi:hypothetical protein
MSREIDTDDLESLSDEELQYLAQRDNQEASALLAERDIDTDQSKEVPIENQANTGDANTAGLTIEEQEAKVEAMAAEQEVEEGEDLDYESMVNDDLRTEIVRRNEARADDDQLSLEGRKADLIATLREDDGG